MKQSIFSLLLFTLVFGFYACGDDEPETPEAGVLELEFDNIAVVNDIQQQLSLVNPGSDDYTYTNGLGQDFNINLLTYYISDIKLEGPNGETFEKAMKVDASGADGIYLVDESKSTSSFILLEGVPAGKYNKLSFTVGVDEDGVQEGAAGGVLDPATCNMFWNWNAGYVAMKFEGQSPVSNGGASGESIDPSTPNAIAYHVGGWRDIEDTPFVYNNKRVTLEFDTDAKVEKGLQPHVHLTMDVLKLFAGESMIDFTGNHNVHKPKDAIPVANNLPAAFAYDHIHQ